MSQEGARNLAIIGGGLAGGLIALAASRAHPDRRVLLIEARPTLGGNHLWNFLGSDILAADRPILEPLITYGWRNYGVVFPSYQRMLATGLYGIRSDRFDQVLRQILPPHAVLSGRAAVAIGPNWVDLDDGTHIDADGVIDARGAGDLDLLDLAWRKFVGYELQLAGPHSVRNARLIEAGEDQDGGLGFFTLLPIESDKLFVEDVRYALDPALDIAEYAKRIFNLAARFGWKIIDSARGQAGALPIAMGGDFERYWQSGEDGVAKAGMRAGLFHPVTGASLADNMAVARLVAQLSDWSGEALHKALQDHARRAWKGRGFYRRFARQMVRHTPPAGQLGMLEALYAMDPAIISRFNRADLSLADRIGFGLSGGPMKLITTLKS
jgi:lycopene beta-cyclase